MTSRAKTTLGWILILAAVVVMACFAYQSSTYSNRLARWEVDGQQAMLNFTIGAPMSQKPSLWSYGLAAGGLAVGGVVILMSAADDTNRALSDTAEDGAIGAGPAE